MPFLSMPPDVEVTPSSIETLAVTNILVTGSPTNTMKLEDFKPIIDMNLLIEILEQCAYNGANELNDYCQPRGNITRSRSNAYPNSDRAYASTDYTEAPPTLEANPLSPTSSCRAETYCFRLKSEIRVGLREA